MRTFKRTSARTLEMASEARNILCTYPAPNAQMILVHWIRKVARFRIRQLFVQEALVFESKYIVSIELDGTKW
jgi:hypothetical protein